MHSDGQRPLAVSDLLKLWNVSPTIVNSVATLECRPIPWELRRKSKSCLFAEFNGCAQSKFQKWSNEFRWRRNLRSTVQINAALQFVLLTRVGFKLPIEVYRVIHSFFERGVVVQDLESYLIPVRRAVDAHHRYSQQAPLLRALRTY